MVFFPLLVQYDMVCPDRTNQTNGDEDYIYIIYYIVVYLVGRDDSASFQGFDPPTQPFITKHRKGIQKHLTKATPKKLI